MKFVLVSTHVDQATGYSKVAYNLLRQLATLTPKVKIYHFGFQRHPAKSSIRKVPEGVVCYDAAANEEPKEEGFGFNKINEYLEMVSPDVVMIYNDPLVIFKFLESIKVEKTFKLWIYIDQVYNGIAQPVIEKINEKADRIYCFTEQWKKRYLEYKPHSDVRVLEHAVDPLMFTSLPVDARYSIRQKMNLSNDAILFLNMNRNSQRKRIDLTIMGFVKLIKNNPDKPYHLVLATTINPQAGAYYDVQRIFIEELKMNNMDPADFVTRLIIVDSSAPNIVTDEVINQIYNISDIGVNTSNGEGYGLCQLEHMYTGAPQVVTDVGDYRAFMNESVAEFIPVKGRSYMSGAMPFGAYAPDFDIDDVTTAMQKAADTLIEKRKALNKYNFKSWSNVCDSFLEDVIESK